MKKFEMRKTINGLEIFKIEGKQETRLHPPFLALHNEDDWNDAREYFKEDIDNYF